MAPTSSEPARDVYRLAYEVREPPSRWLLDEDDVPESPDHDQTLRLLVALLEAWIARTGRNARVARNLACRWDPEDARVGVDPDVALIEPDHPSIQELGQLRLWLPAHVPPRLAFEVVSESTAAKDYRHLGARYSRLGSNEVWAFDPELYGPPSELGPHVLTGWQRRGSTMLRIYAGDGPAWSDELQAWLVPIAGGRLRFADDEEGKHLWLTAEEQALEAAAMARSHAEEQQRRAEEQQRRAEEQQRRAEAAEAELLRLRALLDGR